MKSSLFFLAIVSLAFACNQNPQTVTLDTGDKTGLKGSVVRDHSDGAEIVTSPRPDYAPGTIIVEVDDSPVKGAAQLRDLLRAAEQRVGGYKLTAVPPEALNDWRKFRDEQAKAK